MCDDNILRLLADGVGRTVLALAEHFQVTKTAIRERLIRMMAAQTVIRQPDAKQRGRGRPQYLYYAAPRDGQ